jgi:hypothetical protein
VPSEKPNTDKLAPMNRVMPSTMASEGHIGFQAPEGQQRRPVLPPALQPVLDQPPEAEATEHALPWLGI